VKFSVIIPLYNKENYIARAVNCVLSQEFLDYELIIVNDGSTDSSLDIVSRIADKRIRIIDKVNGGVSSARNCGLVHALNEWICLLDADDFWLPNHLTEIANLINKYPDGHVYSTMIGVNTSSGVKRIRTSLPMKFEGYLHNYFCYVFIQAVFHSSSICISREALKETGYFDVRLKHGEDLDMWYRLMLNFRGVAKDVITAVYDLNTENRAMLLKCKFENHILSKIPEFRKGGVPCLNDYVDYYVLRNSLPYYFSEQRCLVIHELDRVLQSRKVGIMWRFIYSKYLYAINSMLYKVCRGLKNL
jgi:glycosyltransferase involved in cell wall biosynthesis